MATRGFGGTNLRTRRSVRLYKVTSGTLHSSSLTTPARFCSKVFGRAMSYHQIERPAFGRFRNSHIIRHRGYGSVFRGPMSRFQLLGKSTPSKNRPGILARTSNSMFSIARAHFHPELMSFGRRRNGRIIQALGSSLAFKGRMSKSQYSNGTPRSSSLGILDHLYGYTYAHLMSPSRGLLRIASSQFRNNLTTQSTHGPQSPLALLHRSKPVMATF